MNQLKKFIPIILILSVLLALVFTRNGDPQVFKAEVSAVMEGARNQANQIKPGELSKLPGSWLLIDFSGNRGDDSLQIQRTLHIPIDNLLDKSTLKMLNESKSTLVLYAAEIGTSTKAWVILNQLGYKNLLILLPEEDPEVLKYKFQPDTTARLEQVSN